MEEPHDEVSTTYTCVSLEILVDGQYAGKGKISFPMQWRILPWMSTMIPCMEKQGPLTFVELVGAICDLLVESANTHDKRGM